MDLTGRSKLAIAVGVLWGLIAFLLILTVAPVLFIRDETPFLTLGLIAMALLTVFAGFTSFVVVRRVVAVFWIVIGLGSLVSLIFGFLPEWQELLTRNMFMGLLTGGCLLLADAENQK
jgi:hypothetical protein